LQFRNNIASFIFRQLGDKIVNEIFLPALAEHHSINRKRATQVVQTFNFPAEWDSGHVPFDCCLINSRGDEAMGITWSYLDITPLGRQETWEDSPEGYPQTLPYKWWNWHDNYDAASAPDREWVKVSDAGEATLRKRDG
jgi:hypothetical protein